jgi:hypothetical protein
VHPRIGDANRLTTQASSDSWTLGLLDAKPRFRQRKLSVASALKCIVENILAMHFLRRAAIPGRAFFSWGPESQKDIALFAMLCDVEPLAFGVRLNSEADRDVDQF